MRKNPYDVLGIGRLANLKDIKSAYRSAVKKNHPDGASSAPTTDRFCEIQEAYETLKDARRRERCDRELARRDAETRRMRQRAQRPRRAFDAAGAPRRPVEPVDPGTADRHFSRTRPLAMGLEIILSPMEAFHGGVFPIRLPVETTCPACGVVARVDFCPHCRGTGRLHRPVSFLLELPPGIKSGSRATVRLEIPGLGTAELEIRFRIDPLGI